MVVRRHFLVRGYRQAIFSAYDLVVFACAGQHQYSRRQPEKTLLYRLVADNLETFLADREAEGRGLPSSVVRELRGFLTCGVLQHGFLRVVCEDCHAETLVAFSCKGRGFCPGCGAKRTAATAARLVDEVFPTVPVRQWVITFPLALRYWMVANQGLATKIHRIVTRAVTAFLAAKAEAELGVVGGHGGGVTFVQYFGSALNVAPHFHIVALEGVYDGAPDSPRFHRLSPPTTTELAEFLAKLAARIIAFLERRGLLKNTSDNDVDAARNDAEDAGHDAMASAVEASISQRIAFGPRAGQPVRRIGRSFGILGEAPIIKGEKCVAVNGFTLHAATHVGPHQRQQLERLLRYTARSSVALERLALRDDGLITYQLKRRWADGTEFVLFSPQEFLEKIAALIPPAKFHLTRYFGVLAPNSAYRAGVVPKPLTVDKQPDGDLPREAADVLKRASWGKMLARVYAIDVTRCAHCGGAVRIIAAVTEPDVIKKILVHLGIGPDPPVIKGPRLVYEREQADDGDAYDPDGD